MTVQFQHDCAHCFSKIAAFTIKYQHNRVDDSLDNYVFAICSVCNCPSMFRYIDKLRAGNRPPVILVNSQSFIAFPGQQFFVQQSWPEVKSDVPTDVPENVRHFYEQGVMNEGAKNWDAAGAMFRKALDVATKTIDQALAKKPLYNRIETLRDQGAITTDLATWAHEVRIEGNGAVHDDEPESEQDVQAMHEFCKGFLSYVFSLPALVKNRRSQ